jgi:lipopolysaccharide transport system permease protein
MRNSSVQRTRSVIKRVGRDHRLMFRDSTTAGSTGALLAAQKVTLRPRKGWQPLDMRELWRYRGLLWILATRDIKVRYKQTVLGAVWAIIQPLFTMVVFTMISRLGRISTDGLPAPIFYYAGMLPWLLFSNAVTNAGNSLVGSQNLITKVYFPRLVIPIASVLTSLIDFAIALVMLAALMVWYRIVPGPQMLLLPIFVLLGFAAALGVGLGLSAMNVEFRDVRYVIPFLMQIWLFCTPVLYTSSAVSSRWKRLLLGLNPMSGVVEGFRWCTLGQPRPGSMLGVSGGTIAVVLICSLFYFRRMEQSFADRV